MGGKAQQRVAGNAKPSNSGRIRELLINQQLGPGNIITFSALSAKNNQQQQQQKHKKGASKHPEDKSENNRPASRGAAAVVATPEPADEQQQQPKSILHNTSSAPTSKDITRLVVRRVGNRDLYTRVRFSDDQPGTNDTDTLQPAVHPSEAGVKKPPPGLLGQHQMAESSSEPDPDDDHQEEHKDEGKDGQELEREEPEEQLDFDALLDRLEQVRALSDQTPVKLDSLRQLSQESIEHECEMLKLFRVLLRRHTKDLSIEDWDLIVRSLNKWIHWISKTEHPLQDYHQADLCAKVFEFIHQLIMRADKLKRQTEDLDTFPMMQSLIDDWANFRSSSMFLDLIELYLKLIAAESSDQTQLNSTIRPMIESLAHIIVTVDPRMVLSHHSLLDYLDTKVEFDPEFEAPKNSIFCSVSDKQLGGFSAICGLLRSNSRVILVTAHPILKMTMDNICENAQSSALIQDHETVDDVLIFPPAPLMAILTFRDSIMSALLSDYRVGDISVTIEPSTDSYACTLSYLFAWDLAIQFIVGVDKEIGQCIIHSLKKLGLLQRLLDNIFMLLPPLDARDSLSFKIESSDKHNEEELNQSWSIKNFLKQPLKTTIKRPVNEIELVALHLYFSIASHMPVTVRKWYNNNANKRLCNLVNEYTVKHISQVICSLEMESVQEKCQERANRDVSTNLTIKARPSAKEVYAIYTRDEFKMELTIKLPQNYPLGPIQIDGGKRVGVTDVKWRSWLLQLTTFLSHQNGPILDGIDLWRKNIDKRFEGVEKCTICFSILHSNYQLPKKKCQNCANMFHNLCLYKWFESSGNSTCPLCRNPW